jgi:transcriptional regulator with XRE-family HTH domain
VGRPSRIADIELAEEIREFMNNHGLSLSAMAASLGIDKSTLSRSLKARSFSRRVRNRASLAIRAAEGGESTEKLLLKALRLLELSGTIRSEAELAISQAIDQAAKER